MRQLLLSKMTAATAGTLGALAWAILETAPRVRFSRVRPPSTQRTQPQPRPRIRSEAGAGRVLCRGRAAVSPRGLPSPQG